MKKKRRCNIFSLIALENANKCVILQSSLNTLLPHPIRTSFTGEVGVPLRGASPNGRRKGNIPLNPKNSKQEKKTILKKSKLSKEKNMEEKKTMFRQEPAKIDNCDRHNYRLYKNIPDYIFSHLTPNNESYVYDERSTRQAYDDCVRLYQKIVGQKMQAKAAPIREGIVLIKEDTTLDQVKEVAQQLAELLGWKLLQVHIHRDEGHMRRGRKWTEEEKQNPDLNLHAHIIFDVQDKSTGKMIKPTSEKLKDAQDICAKVLSMQRGKESKKKHIDILDFKIQEQEKQLQSLILDNQNLIAENDKIRLEIEDNKYLIEENAKLRQEIEDKEDYYNRMDTRNKFLRQRLDNSLKQTQELDNNLLAIINEIGDKKKTNQNYKKWNNQLELKIKELEEKNKQLKEENDKLSKENKNIIQEQLILQMGLDDKKNEIKSIDEEMKEKMKKYENMLRDMAGDEGIKTFMAREIKRMSEESNYTEAEILQEIEEHIEELNKSRGLKR